MILSTLELTNFRNYESYKIDFLPITVFVGQNGIGKTNLIEAIYMLSVGKSYRVQNDMETIYWGKDFSRIIGKNEENELELFVSISPKAIKSAKVNKIKNKTTELFGKLKTILFSPESIETITGAPRLRRKFLDLILSQTEKRYLNNLIELQRIIKNRNSLLAGIRERRNKSDELAFWNQKLVEIGTEIIKKRLELIKYINEKTSDFYEKTSGQKKELKLKYIPTVKDLDRYSDLLAACQEREIACSSTLFGPHRDDIQFILDKREMNSFASRGEIRSVIFAIKMTELNFLRDHGGNPLLLLDDIFSELDKNRREKLFEIIKDEQVIIATTDLDLLGSDLRKKAKIINLS